MAKNKVAVHCLLQLKALTDKQVADFGMDTGGAFGVKLNAATAVNSDANTCNVSGGSGSHSVCGSDSTGSVKKQFESFQDEYVNNYRTRIKEQQTYEKAHGGIGVAGGAVDTASVWGRYAQHSASDSGKNGTSGQAYNSYACSDDGAFPPPGLNNLVPPKSFPPPGVQSLPQDNITPEEQVRRMMDFTASEKPNQQQQGSVDEDIISQYIRSLRPTAAPILQPPEEAPPPGVSLRPPDPPDPPAYPPPPPPAGDGDEPPAKRLKVHDRLG